MGEKMKKIMMLGLGVVIGMMLSDSNCLQKPMKKMLKKINIE